MTSRARWIVLAIALALYVPSLAFQRVEWDDQWLWADDSPLRHFDAATAHDVFFELDRHARHPLGSEYLPVRDLSVAADMAVWGSNERGPHATQLVLFGLTVLALGGLLVRFGLPAELAWLGTLIWAVHPIHVESIAWLSERKGVLAGLFFLLCGHAWVRYRDGRSRGWLALAALCAIAATWSKAPGMFGAVVLAAWDITWLRASARRWIAIGVVGLATALAAAPVVLLASDAHVIGEAEAGGDKEGRVATALGAQGHYVESMALVRPFAMSYPMNSDGPTPVDLAIGIAALAGSLGGLAWWARRQRARGEPVLRGLGVALLAWAWIWYLPIGHIVVPLHIIVADRFAYLWSLAACVAVAWLVLRAPGKARLALGTVVVLALAVVTIRAEGAWNTSVDVFGGGCASNPNDVSACVHWAGALDEENRRGEALDALAQSLARHPDDPYLLMKRALIVELAGDRPAALVDAAHAAQAGVGTAMIGYAEMLLRAGRPTAAIPWAERAVARHPELPLYAEILANARRMAAGLPPLPPSAPPAP